MSKYRMVVEVEVDDYIMYGEAAESAADTFQYHLSEHFGDECVLVDGDLKVVSAEKVEES